MSRRPGFLVYGLLSAFVLGSAFPLYWSFVIGSVTKERAIQSPLPLYPGGPNTKGGLRSNPQRQVVDWDDRPIPRLYTAGEISSVFQFAYQGGGNLAEGIAFGRLAARNAAAETPRPSRVR